MSSGNVAYLIEIRGVYDGYSVTVLKDGTFVNRWDAYVEQYPKDTGYLRRQKMTQEWIDMQKEDQNGE